MDQVVIQLGLSVKVIDQDRVLAYANAHAYEWGWAAEGVSYFDESNLSLAVRECVILHAPEGGPGDIGLELVDGGGYSARLDEDEEPVYSQQRRVESSDVDDLVRLAEDLGLSEDQLDMAIYDARGNEDINNEGFEGQIEFLVRHNSRETVEKIIRTVDKHGNYRVV